MKPVVITMLIGAAISRAEGPVSLRLAPMDGAVEICSIDPSKDAYKIVRNEGGYALVQAMCGQGWASVSELFATNSISGAGGTSGLGISNDYGNYGAAKPIAEPTAPDPIPYRAVPPPVATPSRVDYAPQPVAVPDAPKPVAVEDPMRGFLSIGYMYMEGIHYFDMETIGANGQSGLSLYNQVYLGAGADGDYSMSTLHFAMGFGVASTASNDAPVFAVWPSVAAGIISSEYGEYVTGSGWDASLSIGMALMGRNWTVYAQAPVVDYSSMKYSDIDFNNDIDTSYNVSGNSYFTPVEVGVRFKLGVLFLGAKTFLSSGGHTYGLQAGFVF